MKRSCSDRVCTDHSSPWATETGSIRTSSKAYVAATKSATSRRGAIRMRWPEGCSSMTSVNEPNGLVSHMPTTMRVPEVVPSPAM